MMSRGLVTLSFHPLQQSYIKPYGGINRFLGGLSKHFVRRQTGTSLYGNCEMLSRVNISGFPYGRTNALSPSRKSLCRFRPRIMNVTSTFDIFMHDPLCSYRHFVYVTAVPGGGSNYPGQINSENKAKAFVHYFANHSISKENVAFCALVQKKPHCKV